MTWINNYITLQQAAAVGFEVWELILTNFGCSDPAYQSVDETDVIFPTRGTPGLPSVAAIAIGPQSLLDRCFIGYNPLFQVGTLLQTQLVPRRLSREAPLLFTQNGDQQSLTSNQPAPQLTTVHTGSLSVAAGNLLSTNPICDLSTQVLWPALYNKIDGTDAPFGPAATAANSQCRFVTTLLHLLFYVRAPMLSPPTQRIRAYWEMTRTMNQGAVPEEVLAFQLPVMGRREVVVSLFTTGAGVNYRIGGVLLPTMKEIPLASGALTASLRTQVVIQAPEVDYLMIYYNKSMALANNTILEGDVAAVD